MNLVQQELSVVLQDAKWEDMDQWDVNSWLQQINYFDSDGELSPEDSEEEASFITSFKACWLRKWYCTDTYVGTQAYSFNGEVFMLSHQNGRKSDCNYYIIDEELYDTVVSKGMELVYKKLSKSSSYKPEVLKVEDILAMGLYFQVYYAGEVLQKKAYNTDKKFLGDIIKCHNGDYGCGTTVTVKLEDETEVVYDLKDLYFKICGE